MTGGANLASERPDGPARSKNRPWREQLVRLAGLAQPPEGARPDRAAGRARRRR